MARDFYDPYTMRVKEIPELVEELTKLIMPMQPGGKPVATVWGVLCEASGMYKEAMSYLEDPEEDQAGLMALKSIGQQYASGMIIRKIADGMGVSNFKLREVPLERPTVQEPESGRSPGAGEEDQPG